MAEAKRKPVFSKVAELRPGTSGLNLTVKVVDSKLIMQRGRSDGPQVRQMKIAECLVGDETGMIIFTARNDQGTLFICVSCIQRLLVDMFSLVLMFAFTWLMLCNWYIRHI